MITIEDKIEEILLSNMELDYKGLTRVDKIKNIIQQEQENAVREVLKIIEPTIPSSLLEELKQRYCR